MRPQTAKSSSHSSWYPHLGIDYINQTSQKQANFNALDAQIVVFIAILLLCYRDLNL